VASQVSQMLGRYRERGVRTTSALIEAFISETRGAQYIAAQLLSARSRLDVAFPFANEELYVLASAIPIQRKVHNRFNLQLLLRGMPRALDLPFAATLLPAWFPVPLQELSRVARAAMNAAQSRLANSLHGRIEPPRPGWVNFDFLRGGKLLTEIVESLALDIWDKERMLRLVADAESTTGQGSIHPMYDQLGKIHTIDLLFRSGI
jgi:hypothetical protein